MYTADYSNYTVVHVSYLAVHVAYSTVYETYTKLHSWVYNIYCWVHGIYCWVHPVDELTDIFFCITKLNSLVYIVYYLYNLVRNYDEAYGREVLAQKGQIAEIPSKRSLTPTFIHSLT